MWLNTHKISHTNQWQNISNKCIVKPKTSQSVWPLLVAKWAPINLLRRAKKLFLQLESCGLEEDLTRKWQLIHVLRVCNDAIWQPFWRENDAEVCNMPLFGNVFGACWRHFAAALCHFPSNMVGCDAIWKPSIPTKKSFAKRLGSNMTTIYIPCLNPLNLG